MVQPSTVQTATTVASTWKHPNTHLVLPPPAPEPISRSYGIGGFEGMVFSGFGPAVAAVLTNPFDVAKVRMQLQGEASSGSKKAYTGAFDCIIKTFKAEGIAGTQRGLSASIIREGSKNFFRIGLFHPILDVLHEDHTKSPPVWKRLIAGSISGAAGAIICNPIEIVKTRLQASSVGAGAVGYQGYQYKGFIDSFRVIVRDEGVKGLWTGTSISAVRSILATSTNMTVNSKSKEMLLQDPSLAWLGFQPGFLTDGFCSVLSAFFAVGANNPADVVRTRLYNQPFKMVDGVRRGEWYTGSVQCAGMILKDEGPLAFWKGFTGHFMRTGPHYVAAFIVIGWCQRTARTWKEKSNQKSWDRSMVAAFNKFAEPTEGGPRWTNASLQTALRTACPRAAVGCCEREYEALLRADAAAVLSAAGKGAEGALRYAEFVAASPALDAVVARRLANRA